MAYTKTIWNPGAPPGVSAPALTKIEQGIFDAHITADNALSRINGGQMSANLVPKPNTTDVITDSVLKGLSIQSDISHAALMTFIRNGAHAAHFGIDVDNKWKVGGWSMGAVAYELWHDGRMRVHSSGTYVEWFNGSAWQGLGGIKGVQRGISSTSSSTITISAVNMNKSFVTFNNVGNMATDNASVYRCVLTSSTTLQMSQASSQSGNANFAWEVVEFY